MNDLNDLRRRAGIPEPICESAPMKFVRNGLGLSQYANDDIAFAGGMRTGKSGTDGTNRLRYDIYDMAAITAGTPADEARCGKVEINIWPDDSIQGIVVIEIDKKKRFGRIGTRAIQALVATSRDGLHVYDIKRAAVPFWRKMGSSIQKVQGRIEGFIPKLGHAPDRS